MTPKPTGTNGPTTSRGQAGLLRSIALRFSRRHVEHITPGGPGDTYTVTISAGTHPFPSRTGTLSPPEPMVLRKRESRTSPPIRALGLIAWGFFFCAF